MARVLAACVGALAFLGVASSIGFFLREPYNEGFTRFPAVMWVHVVLGGIYLALAPFQLVPRIRRRALGYHRMAGRCLTAIGLVTGATAIFISLVIPFSGWSERIIVGGFAIFFLVALALGFRHVRAGRIELHREWMIRAFAIGLGIATMRVVFIPSLIIFGVDDLETVRLLSILSFAAGFLINGSVAELWIRHTRRHPNRSSSHRDSSFVAETLS
jgi:uncharacterized membrane protein